MLDFSVIIPTFQRPRSLLEAVRGWLDVDYPSTKVEVVVVDDENRGAARRVLESVAAASSIAIRIIDGDRSGAAAARNLGAALSSGRILIFSDDDVKVRPDYLHQQLETREICGPACIVSPAWEYPAELARVLSTYSFGRLLLERVEESQRAVNLRHVAQGCWEAAVVDSFNLSVDNQTFRTLGGFGRDFPGAALLEDCVFGLRARREGLRLIRDHGILVESHESAITLRQVSEREERVAAAYVTLGAMLPDEFGAIPYLVDNGPIRESDLLRTKLKKLSRNLLSRSLSVELAMRFAVCGERLRLSDRALHPYFDRVIGLHTVRGIRAAGKARSVHDGHN
jgi:GT2 family glycosyltransferase